MSREQTGKEEKPRRVLMPAEKYCLTVDEAARYFDDTGKKRSVYSWRLHKNDKTPKGKREKPPIDDLIKMIGRDLDDGISSAGGEMTVLELCQRYVSTKTGVSHNTAAGYKTILIFLSKHPFGKKKINEIRPSSAKLFLINIQKEYSKSYSSVQSIRGVLRPAFQMAFEDDFIRKNPFEFQIHEALIDDRHKREAISAENMRRFLKFVRYDEHFSEYYEVFFILFHTGLRISEFCGLTMSDLDLEEKTLNIDHQLQRSRNGDLYIQDANSLKEVTKTSAGIRKIPITDEVCEAFSSALEKRETPKIEPMVDGHVGFIWLNHRVRKGIRPYVAMDWEHIFTHAVDKFNSIYRVQMPKITPHVCRHTYCTQMAKQGMRPPLLQFLMGHSDITVTMNYYTHLKTEDAKEELKRLKDENEYKMLKFN